MAQTISGARKTAAHRLGLSVTEYESRIAIGLKHCTKCKEWVPVDRFNVDNSRWDGRSAQCHGCTRVKVKKNTKGRPSAFKGRKHTEEVKAAMSVARKADPRYGRTKGLKHSAETKEKIATVTRENTPRGEAHYAYSHGKHQRDLCDRRTVEYKQWRYNVFLRDKFACQECGDDRGGNLQAHHRKSFADHPELRLDVDNGVTLCRPCHEKLHGKPISVRKTRRAKKKAKAADQGQFFD